jgi:hypothetical protein
MTGENHELVSVGLLDYLDRPNFVHALESARMTLPLVDDIHGNTVLEPFGPSAPDEVLDIVTRRRKSPAMHAPDNSGSDDKDSHWLLLQFYTVE